MKRIMALVLALALVFCFAACEWEPESTPEPTPEPDTEQQAPVEQAAEEPQVNWLTYDTYGQLCAAIKQARADSVAAAAGSRTEETMEAEDAMEVPAAAEESYAANDTALDAGAGVDFSTTNLQVEGVDEADIVKTDGRYIYVLRDGTVTVVKADGEQTEEVNSFVVCTVDQQNGYEYPQEMYLLDGGLYVLTSQHSWLADDVSDKTCLRRFDVSDPENGGELTYEVAQDGYYLDSRLLDGKLYLISNYYIYTEPEEGDLRTYVPRYYDTNGKASSFAIEDIAACPGFSDVQYAVVSSVDAKTGKRLSQQTVLGAGTTIYMNKDNLYLAKTRYVEEDSEPYTESIYKVVDRTSRNYTNIVRFGIEQGKAEMKAFTELEGTLSDQFALDEYEGNLRVALTAGTSSWKVYTDEERGFENYVWDEDSDHTDNSLYVLDPDLQVVGRLTGLAENEWIRSVRFNGPIGYVCTFETVDPLFAIDLSDPAAPQVLSALKIPGFSEYLHPWGDGKLIGLGYATSGTENTVTQDCVKLSMFDCSDPTDVKETSVYAIEGLWYSEGLYNHKAVTASKDKNLICFPGDGSYLLFSYDESEGFRQLAEVRLSGDRWYDWNSRGLWSGDYFYVASRCGVAVLSMDDYSVVKEIYFEDVDGSDIPILYTDVYTAD